MLQNFIRKVGTALVPDWNFFLLIFNLITVMTSLIIRANYQINISYFAQMNCWLRLCLIAATLKDKKKDPSVGFGST